MNKLLLIAGLLLLPATSLAAFDTDLRYGSSGASVFELQEFLTDQGVYSGPITGNFYALTLAGVKAFQTRENVAPVSGFFGPITRRAANKLLSEELSLSDEEASTTPVINQPATTTPRGGSVGAVTTHTMDVNVTVEVGNKTNFLHQDEYCSQNDCTDLKGDNDTAYVKIEGEYGSATWQTDKGGYTSPSGSDNFGRETAVGTLTGAYAPGTYNYTLTVFSEKAYKGDKVVKTGSFTIK